MIGWLRRWPPYALNGLSVSLGVGLVQVFTDAFASPSFAQAASIGAVLASVPHLTGRAAPTFRRALAGGLLASLAMLVVLSTAEHAYLRGVAIAVVSFLALMGMAWGKPASPIVFSVTLGMIFSLARPSSHAALSIAAANICGVALYAGWAFLNAKLLEPRYRGLAVFEALEAAAALLHARGAVLSQAEVEPEDQVSARFGQVTDEGRLAEALQVARDLVFPAAKRPGGALQVAILSRVAELREIVLTSRLDLDLLGHDHAARFVRARLALGLRKLSAWLEQLALLQRDGTRVAHSGPRPLAETPELPDLLEAARLFENDERARLLPLVLARLRYLHEEIEAIQSLLSGEEARVSLRPEQLENFVADHDTWPLGALAPHLSLRSPVLRHALRSALAFTTVYFVAYALPWATHPYWMLLSVVVVLRGTLDDTLSRRNSRVLGTALGCVAVTVLLALTTEPVLELTFVVAVGVSHAFVNVRYLLTAISATVMALLQAHFVAPTTAALVVERVLDTVVGALFAWGFSYVLPSWERRSLPAAVERALEALRAYSRSALELDEAGRVEQRLARQRAHDAVAVIAAALRRSSAEPEQVRPPVEPLVSMLDHAQRLMAHLSSLRALLQRRADRLSGSEANTALARARRLLDDRLSLSVASATCDAPEPQASHQKLPDAPADQEPLPWLLRRIDASLQHAQDTSDAARRALGELARSEGV